MNQKQQCKIVQDLLPMYIDELTDEETNKFIEEHIKTCDECREMLEDMQKDLQLEIKEPKKKTNPLKKLKNRYTITIVISVIAAILIVIGVIYFKDNYKIEKDETGNIKISKYTIDEKTMANCRHVIIYAKQEQKDTIDGYLYYTYILSINKDDICVNARVKEEGYKEENLEYKFKSYSDAIKIYNNLQIIKNGIVFNETNFVGKNIEMITGRIKTSTDIIKLEKY